MNAFVMGGAEIIVIVVVSVIVAAAVAFGIAVVLALSRRRSVPPKQNPKTVESRLRELDRLHENGLVTSEEHQQRRAAILKQI